MQPLTGFAHALICQRVALPSFSVLAQGAACEERRMKELVLPVPKMVSATYVVPVPTPMGTAEARQQASTAVETRLTGPLRTLTAEWLAKGGGEGRGRGSRSAAIRVAGQGAVRHSGTAGLPRPCARVRPVQCHAASIADRHAGMEGARPGRGARCRARRTRAGPAGAPGSADYEKYGPPPRVRYLHGHHGVMPPVALIALFARVTRSTNRSTPHYSDHRMPATERHR